MYREQIDIDDAKLRKLMSERRAANQRVISLTDEMLELRREIQRIESRHKQNRRAGQPAPHRSELADLEGLRQQRAQILEDRDRASEESNRFGFVERLVAFARKNGFNVDEQKCTAYRPAPDQPRQIAGEGGVKL